VKDVKRDKTIKLIEKKILGLRDQDRGRTFTLSGGESPFLKGGNAANLLKPSKSEGS